MHAAHLLQLLAGDVLKLLTVGLRCHKMQNAYRLLNIAAQLCAKAGGVCNCLSDSFLVQQIRPGNLQCYLQTQAWQSYCKMLFKQKRAAYALKCDLMQKESQGQ